VQDVEIKGAHPVGQAKECAGFRDAVAHRLADKTQRQHRLEAREYLTFVAIAGDGIAEDADMIAGLVLRLDQVADVPKNAARRLLQHVDDAEGRWSVRASGSCYHLPQVIVSHRGQMMRSRT
jgi:hypothetical protein